MSPVATPSARRHAPARHLRHGIAYIVASYHYREVGELKTRAARRSRCLQHRRIRHRGLYALKDTFVTHTLAVAEESGDVERLSALLVRQTRARLDTLKQHYERWWPRDREAVRATYAMLEPTLDGGNCHRIATGAPKTPGQTANRTWTMSPSCTA